MNFHNALTGTITIGDVGIRPEPGFAAPSKSRRKPRSITRPRVFPVDPAVLANLTILAPDEHEEIETDMVFASARVADDFNGNPEAIRPAITAPARVRAEGIHAKLKALIGRIMPDAITREEFFIAAKRIDEGRVFDALDLARMYDVAIGYPRIPTEEELDRAFAAFRAKLYPR